MIVRIPQQTRDDCAICTVAMAMGWPYDYGRVLTDSAKYPKISDEGKFLAWWEAYFRDEGFETIYCHSDGLHALHRHRGAIVGMLGMDIPHLKSAHIVAVDELGVIDPADKQPDHVPLDAYVRDRLRDGFEFHTKWLAIRKHPSHQPWPPLCAVSGKSAGFSPGWKPKAVRRLLSKRLPPLQQFRKWTRILR